SRPGADPAAPRHFPAWRRRRRVPAHRRGRTVLHCGPNRSSLRSRDSLSDDWSRRPLPATNVLCHTLPWPPSAFRSVLRGIPPEPRRERGSGVEASGDPVVVPTDALHPVVEAVPATLPELDAIG